MQKKLETLFEDIQKLKDDIKKIYNLAFRNKFSMSFLLDLEDLM